VLLLKTKKESSFRYKINGKTDFMIKESFMVNKNNGIVYK